MTTVEHLRDIAQANQARESVGHHRFSRNRPFGGAAIATPTGTKLPTGRPIQADSWHSSSQSTGGYELDRRLLSLRQSGIPPVSTTDGLLQLSELYDDIRRRDWVEIVSAALAAIPSVGTTSPGIDVLSAGVSGLVSSAVRAWQAARLRSLESFVASIPEEHPSRGHAGIAAIDWLRAFLGISLDRVFRIGHISPATYYAWKAKPSSGVRPATIESLLRVVASVKVLESARGAEDTRRTLLVGSPTFLDRLAGEGEAFEQALRELDDLARPTVESPPPRMTDPVSIMERLRSLDTAAAGNTDPRPLGSARQLSGQADDSSDVEDGGKGEV